MIIAVFLWTLLFIYFVIYLLYLYWVVNKTKIFGVQENPTPNIFQCGVHIETGLCKSDFFESLCNFWVSNLNPTPTVFSVKAQFIWDIRLRSCKSENWDSLFSAENKSDITRDFFLKKNIWGELLRFFLSRLSSYWDLWLGSCKSEH